MHWLWYVCLSLLLLALQWTGDLSSVYFAYYPSASWDRFQFTQEPKLTHWLKKVDCWGKNKTFIKLYVYIFLCNDTKGTSIQ